MGAICEACGKDMLKVKGCTFTHIEVDGQVIKRDLEHWQEPGERCHDCGAMYGQPHHPGCDVERCPICGGQMIGCRCYGDKEVFYVFMKKNRTA